MTYTGKWTCDKCEHTSDNEHDPCNCDEECCDHVETIASLRTQLRALRSSAPSAALLSAEERESLEWLFRCVHGSILRTESDGAQALAVLSRLLEQSK